MAPRGRVRGSTLKTFDNIQRCCLALGYDFGEVSVSPAQQGLYRLLFHARISKLSGMAFQNFFSQIMQYKDPGFVPVKPQGNLGDWKNDGHNPSKGQYFQVYSPESAIDESSAVKKLEEDFAGLVAKWGEKSVYPKGVEEFWFVLNDHLRVTPGGYPTTLAALAKLKKDYGLKDCGLFLAHKLEDIVLSLPEDQIIAVLGFPPNPADIKVLNLELIDEVVRHIVESAAPRSLTQSLVDPDFDTKITFNNLSVGSAWLRDATYRRGTLEEYFRANSTNTRQEVRNRLKGIYEEGLLKDFEGESNGITAGDKRLASILREITPNSPNGDRRLQKELEDAALVVIAYFFETCDIFEEPAPC